MTAPNAARADASFQQRFSLAPLSSLGRRLGAWRYGIGMTARPGERFRGMAQEPLRQAVASRSLEAKPFAELLAFDVDAFEERPVQLVENVDLHFGVRRPRQRLEAFDIVCEGADVEPGGLLVADDGVCAECRPQGRQRVSQTAARLFLAAVWPKQSCQLATRVHLAARRREIGKQLIALARGQHPPLPHPPGAV